MLTADIGRHVDNFLALVTGDDDDESSLEVVVDVDGNLLRPSHPNKRKFYKKSQPHPRIHTTSRPGDLPQAKYEHSECRFSARVCKEPLQGFHAPKKRKNCGGRGGLGWMGLDDVGLVEDDGV